MVGVLAWAPSFAIWSVQVRLGGREHPSTPLLPVWNEKALRESPGFPDLDNSLKQVCFIFDTTSDISSFKPTLV